MWKKSPNSVCIQVYGMYFSTLTADRSSFMALWCCWVSDHAVVDLEEGRLDKSEVTGCVWCTETVPPHVNANRLIVLNMSRVFFTSKRWWFQSICWLLLDHLLMLVNDVNLNQTNLCLCAVVSLLCATAVTSGRTSPFMTVSLRNTPLEHKLRK